MNNVILKARDLDGYLSLTDKKNLAAVEAVYARILECLGEQPADRPPAGERAERLIALYNEMGLLMRDICQAERGLNVYGFQTPHETHAEASRLIAKLRDAATSGEEFVYYIQRAYELLFTFAWGGAAGAEKTYLVVKTPVTSPVQNYAVHKITRVDEQVSNSVMCVMLRGALLPSMIMSKEIEEYSSMRYLTPFALFRIRRDDTKRETNMEYILDLDRSYFDLASLDGRDLIFADPMNATGGSLVTIVSYLRDRGVRPRSVSFFNVISALKGALRVSRALENCRVYTLWMDGALNDSAYILPGLGDAGDRINGMDSPDYPRNIMQLIAGYGGAINRLYRSQLRAIENTVLSAAQRPAV